MLETVDMDCTLNLMAKQGVDLAQKIGFEQARNRVHSIAVEALRTAQGRSATPAYSGMPGKQPMPGMSQERPIPDSLKLLPLYAMALQKCLALRGGQDVRIDERAYYHTLVANMDIEESKVFVYPRMFSIHDMAQDCGLPVDNNELLSDPSIQFAGPDHIKLPSILNLSHDRLDSSGLILLDNGHDMFMWIGRTVNPALLTSIFGLSTMEGVDMSALSILSESCDFAFRLDVIINALRSKRFRFMPLHFLKEGDGYADAFFSRYLVEDRYESNLFDTPFSLTDFDAELTLPVGVSPMRSTMLR